MKILFAVDRIEKNELKTASFSQSRRNEDERFENKKGKILKWSDWIKLEWSTMWAQIQLSRSFAQISSKSQLTFLRSIVVIHRSKSTWRRRKRVSMSIEIHAFVHRMCERSEDTIQFENAIQVQAQLRWKVRTKFKMVWANREAFV